MIIKRSTKEKKIYNTMGKDRLFNDKEMEYI